MRQVLIAFLVTIFAATGSVAAETDITADNKPRVHLISVIGTMIRQPEDGLNYTRYALTGEERLTTSGLLASVPEAERFAEVTIESDQFLFTDSPAELLALADIVNTRLAENPDIAGIVIAHGTNNIEETAYFLNLTVTSDRPVVITGSQRPSGVLSSDAGINLVNAVRTAADPHSVDKGVLVVMNSEIHAARDVTKVDTYNPAGFQSLVTGPIGFADPDRIIYYHAPVRLHTHRSELHVDGATDLPRVNIIYSYSGDDDAFVEAAIASGARGIVMAGSGAGNMQNAVPALERAQNDHGLVVVRSARGGTGRVICNDNWHVDDFVCADNLNPQKARMLLQLALATTDDPAAIQALFDSH